MHHSPTEETSALKDLSNISLHTLDEAAAQVSSDHIPTLLQNAPLALVVPSCFLLEEWENDANSIDQQAHWRAASSAYLSVVLAALQHEPELSLEKRAELFIAISRFEGEDDDWITPLSRKTALQCLNLLLLKDRSALIKHTLNTYLRNCFVNNLHPFVNPTTGRELPRAIGGPQASRGVDGLGGTKWKGQGYQEAIGCWNVLHSCVDELEASEIQDLWPLIIPPLMTLTDDHETTFRIRGLRTVSLLISKTSASFLTRTSLHNLIQKSLTTSLTYLSQPVYAPLVSHALRTNLQLIDHLYSTPSPSRFEALSTLMLNGPMKIWVFAPEKIVFATLAAEAVISITNRMSIGVLRFFGDVLHPLLRTLGTVSIGEVGDLLLVTARAVRLLCQVGRPVLKRWRGLILSNVAKCWLARDDVELRVELKAIVGELRADSGLTEGYIKKMKDLGDPKLNMLFE